MAVPLVAQGEVALADVGGGVPPALHSLDQPLGPERALLGGVVGEVAEVELQELGFREVLSKL